MSRSGDTGDVDRRSSVLDAALLTFARHGYRRTSMEQVARDADISRPGLYFLFDSKQALFREAVEQSLHRDLTAAEHALSNPAGTLRDRLLLAFDHWAGRYVGPLTRDVATVVADNPQLLGPRAQLAPQRFADLVVGAITAARIGAADLVAQTLISTSIGIKHEVDDRDSYLARLGVALDLLLPANPRRRR